MTLLPSIHVKTKHRTCSIPHKKMEIDKWAKQCVSSHTRCAINATMKVMVLLVCDTLNYDVELQLLLS